MSLLMDALRKSDEAKRQAAQGAKNPDVELPPQPAAPPPAATPEIEGWEFPQSKPAGNASVAATVPVVTESADTRAPEAASRPRPTADLGTRSEANATPKQAPPALTADPPLLSEEVAALPQNAAVLPDQAEVLPQNAAVLPDQAEVLPQESISAGQPIGRPLSAPQAAPATPARKVTKVDALNRKSARSLFTSKQPDKSGKKTTRRNLAIAGVALLLPLAGGTWWVLQEMGSTQSGKFFIPPAGSFDSAALQASDGAQAGEFSDQLLAVTPEPATEMALTVSEEAALLPEPLAAAETALPEEPGMPAAQAPFEQVLAINATAAEPVVPATPQAIVAAPAVPVPESAAADLPPGDQLALTAPLPAPPPTTPAQPTPEPASATQNYQQPNFTRANPLPQTESQVRRAYSSYQIGDYQAARTQYQVVLQLSPNNRDALLGLAAVSLKQNDMGQAREMYSRLLALNPRDALARTGLLETVPSSDPLRLESELKSLLEQYPDVAPLAYALGNLYASQQRWNEAQGSYYDALFAARTAGGPISPDYAFNLAVSLERLNQPRLALTYYNEALELSRFSPPGFPMDLLNGRLQYLEGVPQ